MNFFIKSMRCVIALFCILTSRHYKFVSALEAMDTEDCNVRVDGGFAQMKDLVKKMEPLTANFSNHPCPEWKFNNLYTIVRRSDCSAEVMENCLLQDMPISFSSPIKISSECEVKSFGMTAKGTVIAKWDKAVGRISMKLCEGVAVVDKAGVDCEKFKTQTCPIKPEEIEIECIGDGNFKRICESKGRDMSIPAFQFALEVSLPVTCTQKINKNKEIKKQIACQEPE